MRNLIEHPITKAEALEVLDRLIEQRPNAFGRIDVIVLRELRDLVEKMDGPMLELLFSVSAACEEVPPCAP